MNIKLESKLNDAASSQCSAAFASWQEELSTEWVDRDHSGLLINGWKITRTMQAGDTACH
eukprot:4873473-Amphidinium_carterae.1